MNNENEIDLYKELAEETFKIFGRNVTMTEILKMDTYGIPKFSVGDKIPANGFSPDFTVAKIIFSDRFGIPSWYYAEEGSIVFFSEVSILDAKIQQP